MALVTSNLDMYSIGNRRMHRFDVAFDSVYPTGGETLSLGPIRLRDIDMMMISPTDGYLFEYDYTNTKIKVLTPVGEVLDSLDLRVQVGATAVQSTSINGQIIDHDGRAAIDAAPGSEVAQNTDLSTLTGVRCLAIGY